LSLGKGPMVSMLSCTKGANACVDEIAAPDQRVTHLPRMYLHVVSTYGIYLRRSGVVMREWRLADLLKTAYTIATSYIVGRMGNPIGP
jgi:hypothetical protein